MTLFFSSKCLQIVSMSYSSERAIGLTGYSRKGFMVFALRARMLSASGYLTSSVLLKRQLPMPVSQFSSSDASYKRELGMVKASVLTVYTSTPFSCKSFQHLFM